MKTKIIILIASVCFLVTGRVTVLAQSLGLNNSSPNASAILDATSTSKGILIPRMTSAQRDAIASPATGLMIYVTDKTIGFYYYDGTRWVSMYSPSSTIIRRKSTDETVCGTGAGCTQHTGTTLQNDDELAVPLQANQSYIIEGFLFMIASGSVPDCKLGFTVPAGATMTLGYHANYGDNNTSIATDILTAAGTAGSIIPNNGAGKENPVFISGSITMGSTSGNLQLQWAQNSNSNTQNTTVRANSYLRAMLVQ
ncbi:MAG: hypothetical protein NT126_11665 [Bacteroidetes bacterium]|nr:hypothetical protein [Bacteroidota bacterium]